MYIYKSFDCSEYVVTTITYVKTKLYRKNTKKSLIFIGRFYYTLQVKKELFFKFFDYLKNVLSSVAHVKDDSDVWKTNSFLVSNKRKDITSAIYAVFLNYRLCVLGALMKT